MQGRRAWLPARRAARSGRRRGTGPRWSSRGRASPAACCSCAAMCGHWGRLRGLVVKPSSLLSQCLDRFSQGAFSSLRLPTSSSAVAILCYYCEMWIWPYVSSFMWHGTFVNTTLMLINLFSINIEFLCYECKINLPSKFVNRWVCLCELWSFLEWNTRTFNI